MPVNYNVYRLLDNDSVYDPNAIECVQFGVEILHGHCIVRRRASPTRIEWIFDVDRTISDKKIGFD